MTTAKEALLKAGRIDRIGRGRISNDNHAWLAEQAAKGTKFSDWPKGKVVKTEATTATPAKVKVVRDPNQGNESIVSEYVILYDERVYNAVSQDKRKFGLREVCNNCRVSLVQCHCGAPTILGGIPVTIQLK